MLAAQVKVETERASSNNDVLVRAIAQPGRMNDGRPLAGFLLRRRYHGETFYIQNASEFSAKWMEFVDEPPEGWLPVIRTRYPEFTLDSRFEEAKLDRNEAMNRGELTAKIDSGEFDYSNGAPRKRGRPRKVQ